MDELKKYKERIEKRYNNRRNKTRYKNDGRRREDYHSPRFWTWGFVMQLFTLVIGGLVMLFAGGCAAVKKSLGG